MKRLLGRTDRACMGVLDHQVLEQHALALGDRHRTAAFDHVSL